MVSASEAQSSAIHGGVLEQKKRTGGWKKKYFFLTSMQWLCFDSMESTSPKADEPTGDILGIQRNDSDSLQRSFFVVYSKKKKEFRAPSADDRTKWIQSFESIMIPCTSSSVAVPSSTSASSNNTNSTAASSSSNKNPTLVHSSIDLVKITELMKKQFQRNIQTSKSFSSKDIIQFLVKQFDFSLDQCLEIGQQLIDQKYLIPLKSHVFEESDEKNFKFDEAASSTSSSSTTTASNHMSSPTTSKGFFGYSKTKNLSELMSSKDFDPKAYAEDFLKRHSADKIQDHCKKLTSEKEKTIDALKEEISANYTAFIRASSEITTMENSVSQLKALVLESKKTIQTLKSISLDACSIGSTSSTPNGNKKTETIGISTEKSKTKAVDEFLFDLEVYLNERNYERLVQLLLDFGGGSATTTTTTTTTASAGSTSGTTTTTASSTSTTSTTKQGNSSSTTCANTTGSTSVQSSSSSSSTAMALSNAATPKQKAKVEEIRNIFITKLVEEFNVSMQTTGRMHKKESHLKYLIQLGHANIATEMCLQNYSVRVALQMRHVPSYGNAINYIINLSRTFFTSLLVCYEDFELIFRGQKSSHFISLSVWISAQLERFASEVLTHIFPSSAVKAPQSTALPASTTTTTTAISNSSTASVANTTTTTTTAAGNVPGTGTSNFGSAVVIDVNEFKNVAKYVSNALRYVFYGSRQLELAGLPTAHCLAPHLVQGLLSFFHSYSESIKMTIRDEVKRERWEIVKRTIRDTEKKKLDRDILLTQSARSFYTMMQQFLRDLQKVLSPACATSYLPEIQEAVAKEADGVLLRYVVESKQYLDSNKMCSTIKVKQVAGMLTNVAYIHEDCVARSLLTLQEFLPKSALATKELGNESSTLWENMVEMGMKRMAQGLLHSTIRWNQMELSDENLTIYPPGFNTTTTTNNSNNNNSHHGTSTPTSSAVSGTSTSAATASTITPVQSGPEIKTLFIEPLVLELTTCSNEQLELSMKEYRSKITEEERNEDDNEEEEEDQAIPVWILEIMVQNMLQDETWWNQVKKGERRLGFGGLNKFIAEMKMVLHSEYTNGKIEKKVEEIIKKMSDIYRTSHPERKDIFAGNEWVEEYTKACQQKIQKHTTSNTATCNTTTETITMATNNQ